MSIIPRRVIVITLLLFLQISSASAEEIQIILRTFIPKDIVGVTVPHPADQNKTMLSSPGFGLSCYATDQRTFSDDSNASSRFGGRIYIDTKTRSVRTESIKGVTTGYECTSGAQNCHETSGEGGFRVSVNSANEVISISYQGEANNPCISLSPDIEFSGTVQVNLSDRSVKMVDAEVDVFPAHEAIVLKNNLYLNQLYRVSPKEGSTPADLMNPFAGRKVNGSINY